MQGANNGKGTRVHLISALNQESHAVLAQVSVNEKTNEITAFPVLLDHFMDLKGVVVTADALHTQTSHTRYLAQRGAHYVFTAKANHPPGSSRTHGRKSQTEIGSGHVPMDASSSARSNVPRSAPGLDSRTRSKPSKSSESHGNKTARRGIPKLSTRIRLCPRIWLVQHG